MEALSEVTLEEKGGRAFYSGKLPFQSLSFQLLDQTFNTKRWHHPFLPIADYFSLSENKSAATEEKFYAPSTPRPIPLYISSSSLQQKQKKTPFESGSKPKRSPYRNTMRF